MMTLQKIFEKTTFFTDDNLDWDYLEVEKDHIYIEQGSHLGNTLISLDDTYENSGWDCYFIQELLKAFKEKRLQEK